MWLRRLWTLFSIVFFSQVAVGLLGAERFLMNGELHLPIPAMIIAGPLYRGDGLFRPILFLATVLFVGPAWCSYLYYIESWDLNSAVTRERPLPSKVNSFWIRLVIVAVIACVAVALRLAGVSSFVATWLGAGFGVVGVGLIVTVSRRGGPG